MTQIVDPQVDRVGHVEQAGVDYLPEEARDSRPRNLLAVFGGANFTWTNAVYGWLAVALGLDFWSATISFVVGTVVGALFVMPVSIIGPRTGTNMTVSSGAHYGIRGRFIGSGLSLIFAIVFAALTVWTSGDAIIAAGHRLLGTPQGDLALAISFAVVSALMVAVALYGHATIVAVQKFIIPVVGLIFLAGFYAFSGTFTTHPSSAGYALGGYWATWILNAVLSMAGPISYAPVIGDYTRRISGRKHRDLPVSGSVALGITVGTLVPEMLGIFTACALINATGDYVTDLVSSSPTWYVLPILVVAILGGLGQGTLCIYASGLDLETFFPRFRRIHTTAFASLLAVALLYLGMFVFHAVDSITAATVVLNAVATPWTVVLVIGALRRRRKGYDPYDLQAFAQRRHGGRYWFTAGWNVPAVAAWLAGCTFGVLAVNTQLYAGPLSNILNGVDPSAIGSGLVTAVVYLAAIRLVPGRVDAAEPSDVGASTVTVATVLPYSPLNPAADATGSAS
jgi:purine-cytosine permease-like protein